MNARYLLPCRCGRQLKVEPVDAGRTLPCQCGVEVEVPNLNRLRALAVAPPEASTTRGVATAPPKHRWKAPQQMLAVGILLATFGGGLAAYKLATYPMPIETQWLTPLESWKMWRYYEQGLRVKHPDELYYLDKRKSHRNWIIFGSLLAVAGVVTIVASRIASHSARPMARPVPPPPAREPADRATSGPAGAA